MAVHAFYRDIRAVSYTAGAETGRFVLKTADAAVELQVTVEGEILQADGEEISHGSRPLPHLRGSLPSHSRRKSSR